MGSRKPSRRFCDKGWRQDAGVHAGYSKVNRRGWRASTSGVHRSPVFSARLSVKLRRKMLLGLHHLTALAGDPQVVLDEYTGVRKLRLVKRTVNFDDPGSYHFYFGDHRGSPGTL